MALAGCAESPAPMPRTGPATNLSAFTAQPLWIAAWGGPPARGVNAGAGAGADAGRTFRAAGFEFVIAPTSEADTAGPAPRVLLHDRRLTLDAARGASWPRGVRAAVRAGEGTAGLAGYFVAD